MVLQKAIAKLNLQDLTSEVQNIESLIGLQQDKSKNVVVLNWNRLVNIYAQGSKDENITFYRCNAKLRQFKSEAQQVLMPQRILPEVCDSQEIFLGVHLSFAMSKYA